MAADTTIQTDRETLLEPPALIPELETPESLGAAPEDMDVDSKPDDRAAESGARRPDKDESSDSENEGADSGSKRSRSATPSNSDEEARIDRADLLEAIEDWRDKVAELKVDIRVAQRSENRALNELREVRKRLVELEAANERIALADEARARFDALEEHIKLQAKHIARLDDQLESVKPGPVEGTSRKRFKPMTDGVTDQQRMEDPPEDVEDNMWYDDDESGDDHDSQPDFVQSQPPQDDRGRRPPVQGNKARRQPTDGRTLVLDVAGRYRAKTAKEMEWVRKDDEYHTSLGLKTQSQQRQDMGLGEPTGLPRTNSDAPRHVDDLDMELPPASWINHVVDERGMPADETTWCITHKVQLEGKHWVYAFYHFYLWAYGKDVPEEARTPVQQLAVTKYLQPDWFAKTLGLIHDLGDQNAVALTKYNNLKRASIGYDPTMLATMIQFRQIRIPGVPFMDDCWSLDMCHVRGLSLLDTLLKYRARTDTVVDRKRRLRVEYLIIELMVSPNRYRNYVQQNGIQINPVFEPSEWTVQTDEEILMENLMKWLAQVGVTAGHIDDAFVFGQQYLMDIVAANQTYPVGWVVQDAIDLQQLSSGMDPPPRFFRIEADRMLRHPVLPWQNREENVLLHEMYLWSHKDLAELRRPKDLWIAKKLASGEGVRPCHRPGGRLKNMNPYLRAAAKQAAALASAPTPAVEQDTTPNPAPEDDAPMPDVEPNSLQASMHAPAPNPAPSTAPTVPASKKAKPHVAVPRYTLNVSTILGAHPASQPPNPPTPRKPKTKQRGQPQSLRGGAFRGGAPRPPNQFQSPVPSDWDQRSQAASSSSGSYNSRQASTSSAGLQTAFPIQNALSFNDPPQFVHHQHQTPQPGYQTFGGHLPSQLLDAGQTQRSYGYEPQYIYDDGGYVDGETTTDGFMYGN
ncbi:hypothetical protein B0H17DRAFT_1130407 [Mycena rosella]|uniref:Uncharacterized protein n=1 Tax=Mycena rosella TaxID=1033263 RepID=A0AAD7DSR1_MYCRO|nr:hypothetical protein B0H17DRAFT_1130407 [Mycena rosella]